MLKLIVKLRQRNTLEQFAIYVIIVLHPCINTIFKHRLQGEGGLRSIVKAREAMKYNLHMDTWIIWSQ
jgi:hypothetical protein